MYSTLNTDIVLNGLFCIVNLYSYCTNVLLVVEPFDDGAVLLEHGVSLELERGAQLAGGHAEVAGNDRELLNALRV